VLMGRSPELGRRERGGATVAEPQLEMTMVQAQQRVGGGEPTVWGDAPVAWVPFYRVRTGGRRPADGDENGLKHRVMAPVTRKKRG
jgi:hypothetical protein